MLKKAFTMLELVMVIVVLGILAAVAIPRLENDLRQEAADNILSSIRYTQHVALLDDKTDPRVARWQRELWHIRFASYTTGTGVEWFYTISTNIDQDANVDLAEAAIDPANGRKMYNLAGDDTIGNNESPTIFIGKNYGVNTVDFSQCTGSIGSAGAAEASTHIAFDNVGRPHKGIYSGNRDFRTIMHADCNITFGFSNGTDPVTITIEKQTGHAFISTQINS